MRPPKIDAGVSEPEKRQVASAGDGLPDGTLLAVHPEPTVPIDDFMEHIVRRRQATQQFAGIRIDKNGVLSAKIDNHRSGGIRLYRDNCRTDLGITFPAFSYQFIQAQSFRFRTP